MPVKYTDIDYVVFTDAARFVYEGDSPYLRETYRYTPLLAWMLVPTAFGGLWFHFGKVLFMACDLLTGLLIYRILPALVSTNRRVVLLALWLLNPMVITISTRGSSESVLTFIILLAVDTLLRELYFELAMWLGVAIHFKIYPIIYLPAIMYYLVPKGKPLPGLARIPVLNWLNGKNITYAAITAASVSAWNYFMFLEYGWEFLHHSYFYHLTRLDHRHNFSVYNIVLYYKSASQGQNSGIMSVLLGIEKSAFVPQLLISAVLVPLKMAQHSLIACLFVQTFAFVTFNKVMTSQYFIWFLIFLPGYLATSTLGKKYSLGFALAALWVVAQGAWLFLAYRLEFLGVSTFDHGLLGAACGFFLVNCWLIAVFVAEST